MGSVRIPAGPVVTPNVNSSGAKPLPLPPSRKGRGRIKGKGRPKRRCSEKVSQAGEAIGSLPEDACMR
jgi:hypothetical protein